MSLYILFLPSVGSGGQLPKWDPHLIFIKMNSSSGILQNINLFIYLYRNNISGRSAIKMLTKIPHKKKKNKPSCSYTCHTRNFF